MLNINLKFASGGRFALPAQASWIRPFMPAGVVGAYMLLAGGQPIYVGRSDTCLRSRLAGHEHLGAASHLVWQRCDSSRRAYHLEAYWYDRLKDRAGMLNRVHPARPSDCDEPCPFCAIEQDALPALPSWPGPAETQEAP